VSPVLPVVSVPAPLMVSAPVPVPFNELTVSVPIAVESADSVLLPELLQPNDMNAIIAINNTRLIFFVLDD